jgi:hypothetical protein
VSRGGHRLPNFTPDYSSANLGIAGAVEATSATMLSEAQSPIVIRVQLNIHLPSQTDPLHPEYQTYSAVHLKKH